MDQGYSVQNIKSHEAGQAFLIAVLLVLFSVLILIGTVTTYAYRGTKISEIDLRSKRSYFLSEAGIEDAIYRAKTGKPLPFSYTLSLYGVNTNITVTNIAGGKEIQSASNINNVHRVVKATIKQGLGVSFAYAIQVGRGGINLENSSRIIGTVYANGNIYGKNTSEIAGDAYAASTSSISGDNSFLIGGTARAHLIDGVSVSKSATSTTSISDSTIGLNAYADSISGSTIKKDAYYSSISGTLVGGSTYPGTPPPADLPEIPFPITEAQITGWEQSALAGGIHASPCPYEISSGTVNLGPKKIDCDLTIKNDAIVILNGPLWISGNFRMSNTSQIKLNTAFGPNSEVIVVNNPSDRTTSSKIILTDSAKVLGSGIQGSYVALISQNNSAELGGGEAAVAPQNSVDASIYYAPHGKIAIQNSTSLKEATAYLLDIRNSATVTYESGLASSNFSGPTGGFDIIEWLEIP